MNDDQFDDLKQLVETTIGQTELRLEGRLDKIDSRLGKVDSRLDSIDDRLENLHKEMKEGFAGVGDALDTVSENIDKDIKDHENRITRLEEQAA